MENILTKHPEKGRTGRNIDKGKYDVIRKCIIESLKKNEQMTFTEILKVVEKKLKDKFEGSMPWYIETVKLDLEARKIIERVTKTKPQIYRLK